MVRGPAVYQHHGTALHALTALRTDTNRQKLAAGNALRGDLTADKELRLYIARHGGGGKTADCVEPTGRLKSPSVRGDMCCRRRVIVTNYSASYRDDDVTTLIRCINFDKRPPGSWPIQLGTRLKCQNIHGVIVRYYFHQCFTWCLSV